MDISHALTYIFEDKQWVSKIVLLIVMLFLAFIPVLGLVALAAALGFLVQVADGVRQGLPRPLPKWDDYGEKIGMGAHLLTAIAVYHLPLLLLNGCMAFIVNVIGGGSLGTFISVVVACCTFPLSIVYTLFIWTLLAVGLAEYLEQPTIDRFFRPVHLWDVIRSHGAITRQWMLAATLVNFAILALGWIPCLGQVLVFALVFPVHGHLLGQYARQLRIPQKAKA